jgi:hypothetical protein
MLRRVPTAAAWLLIAAVCSVPRIDAAGADPCDGFSWNVKRERALFAGTAQKLQSGRDVASAPSVVPDRFYEIALYPQPSVHFRLPPGKEARSGEAFGGVLRLRVTVAGLYRVSADEPFWIDVVAGDQTLSAVSHQGSPGCHRPHKIVQFNLDPGQDLIVQLSGASQATGLLTITPAPHP